MSTRLLVLLMSLILGIGLVMRPEAASARTSGWRHSGVHGIIHSSPIRPHHQVNRGAPLRRGVLLGVPYYPYGYVYPNGNGSDTEGTPPPEQKPVTEKRRACEPQTYTVPSISGGESQVTIVRC